MPIIITCIHFSVSGENQNFIKEYTTETTSIADVQPVGLILETQAIRTPDAGLALYRNSLTQDIVIDYFNSITHSEEITRVICKKADKYSVPLTLAFALCGVESQFRVDAVGKNAVSEDRGLFQLNSLAWPHLTNEDFFSIERNADHGLKYLRYCLDRGENEVVALAMYNAGEGRIAFKGAPLTTLYYISKIIDYRDKLDGEFQEYLLEVLQT
ncbi:MAG: lytic transglycosylase domain-containing protein [Spirochaetales bacterium]|nr:lytic transglycosylase domain-containing protein [Spirochaetales bacterium]